MLVSPLTSSLFIKVKIMIVTFESETINVFKNTKIHRSMISTILDRFRVENDSLANLFNIKPNTVYKINSDRKQQDIPRLTNEELKTLGKLFLTLSEAEPMILNLNETENT